MSETIFAIDTVVNPLTPEIVASRPSWSGDFHAGTFRNADGEFEVNGGRVLVIQAAGATRADAVAAVYREADQVTFDGARSRRDVGTLHFT